MTLQDVKKKIPSIQRQLNGGQKKIVVIDGPSGPTGKTTAARILADAGIPVYEEYQVIRITAVAEYISAQIAQRRIEPFVSCYPFF